MNLIKNDLIEDMKSFSLLFLIFLLFMSCTSSEEPEPVKPDISNISGIYFGGLQHDVISERQGLYEEIDTSLQVNDFQSIVSYESGLITFEFPKTGNYILPELKYEVNRIETSDLFGIIDVHLNLLTTQEFRMKATPNQVVLPVFRILSGDGSIRPSPGFVEMTLFLRSNDPDSVYNIWVLGAK